MNETKKPVRVASVALPMRVKSDAKNHKNMQEYARRIENEINTMRSEGYVPRMMPASQFHGVIIIGEFPEMPAGLPLAFIGVPGPRGGPSGAPPAGARRADVAAEMPNSLLLFNRILEGLLSIEETATLDQATAITEEVMKGASLEDLKAVDELAESALEQHEDHRFPDGSWCAEARELRMVRNALKRARLSIS